ncbi:hypothetical protein EDC01DRAFT_764734 [Geopyxis carbonaria]|nr:hypothetical protein EDC01DRAFT_764734 [Geopyxis carbonaria]
MYLLMLPMPINRAPDFRILAQFLVPATPHPLKAVVFRLLAPSPVPTTLRSPKHHVWLLSLHCAVMSTARKLFELLLAAAMAMAMAMAMTAEAGAAAGAVVAREMAMAGFNSSNGRNGLPGYMDGSVDGFMGGRAYGFMGAWRYGSMDGFMSGRRYGFVGGLTYTLARKWKVLYKIPDKNHHISLVENLVENHVVFLSTRALGLQSHHFMNMALDGGNLPSWDTSFALISTRGIQLYSNARGGCSAIR